MPLTSGLYASVLNEQVVYIGIAANLQRRIVGGHCRALPTSKLHYVAAQLHRALRTGGRVRVMIATPRPRSWKGIPVDTALGLEPALIEQAQPPWNVLGIQGDEALEIRSQLPSKLKPPAKSVAALLTVHGRRGGDDGTGPARAELP